MTTILTWIRQELCEIVSYRHDWKFLGCWEIECQRCGKHDMADWIE